MQSFTKQCLFFTEKAEFVVASFSRLTAPRVKFCLCMCIFRSLYVCVCSFLYMLAKKKKNHIKIINVISLNKYNSLGVTGIFSLCTIDREHILLPYTICHS